MGFPAGERLKIVMTPYNIFLQSLKTANFNLYSCAMGSAC